MKLIELKPLFEYVKPEDVVDVYTISAMPKTIETQASTEEIFDRVRKNLEHELWILLLKEIQELIEFTDEGVAINKWYEKFDVMTRFGQKDEHFDKLRDEIGHDWFDTMIRRTADILLAKPANNVKEDFENLGYLLSEFGWLKIGDDVASTIEYLKRENFDLSIQGMTKIFTKLDWEEAYGGELWSNIATLGFAAVNEKHNLRFIQNFDRFIDMAHNSGSILDKMAHSKTLKMYLDYKQHSQNLKELLPHTSSSLKKMLSTDAWKQRMMKEPRQGGGESIQGLVNVFHVNMSRPEFLEKVGVLSQSYTVAKVLRNFLAAKRFPEQTLRAAFNAAAKKTATTKPEWGKWDYDTFSQKYMT